MRERKLSENLWKRFYLIGDDVFEALRDYLEMEPGSLFYGKVFKLNINRYGEGFEKFIGVKMFEDFQLYVLVKFEKTQVFYWILLENGLIEYAESVSRIDLILFMLEEVEENYKDENYWIDDTTGIKPQST